MDSHVRYGHFHFPRQVALKCATCGRQASATNVDCPADYAHFLDIASFRNLWLINCFHCGFGREANWQQLKAYELWYKLVLRDEEVWAWNHQHLGFIIQRLEKKVNKAHAWAYFETYLPKTWLTKLSKEQYVNKLKALLS
ncbi:hypothetical protein GCM10027346_25420 [Hymenobacter seoulensis]